MNVGDITALARRIGGVPLRQGRRIIAIAGPPASGKTTLANTLATHLENACVVPMDGFHRDNEDLIRDGLLDRKGAPETFHAQDFVTFIRNSRRNPTVSFPTFDRGQDRSVPGGGTLHPKDQTILVEGNYLLLNRAPWQDLRGVWDLTVKLDVPLATLRERLIARWLAHGHSRDAAITRAEGNDIPNAETVLTESMSADVTVHAT